VSGTPRAMASVSPLSANRPRLSRSQLTVAPQVTMMPYRA